jgi:glucuronyl/N-acetylglucosaminyl transferase EXT1
MKKFLTIINIGLILNLVLIAYKLLFYTAFNWPWQCLTFINTYTQHSHSSAFRLNFKNSNTSYFNENFTQTQLDEDDSRRGDLFRLKKCTMEKCFNFTKCTNDYHMFKIHIYNLNDTQHHTSPMYKSILSLLRKSKYFTTHAHEACVYVLPYDTLSRDRLSSSYVRDLRFRLLEQQINNLQNHLVFNLYAGSYPTYAENELDIVDDNENMNGAMLAKASFSIGFYRNNFDIAYPLFHSEMPVNHHVHNANLYNKSRLGMRKKYLLSFKGKRYLHGIGIETRNSLYHLNNRRGDVLLVTTW